jgi:transcription elongation factor Elf1
MGGKRKSAKRVQSKKKTTVPKVRRRGVGGRVSHALARDGRQLPPLCGTTTAHPATPPRPQCTAPLPFLGTLQVFKCPFCSHESSCEVKLDREAETGVIACRVCGEAFQTRISFLSDPVDVFCAWVDELNAARGSGGGAGGGGGSSAAAGGDGAGAAAGADADALT